MNALWSPRFITLDRPVFAWDSSFARLTLAKKSITDYCFAIGNDRMTEQHEETEEPCEFKFCVMIALCHVILIIKIPGLCQPRTLPSILCSRQDAFHVSCVNVCCRAKLQ